MNYIKRKEFLKKCADTFGCCGVTITAIVGIADQCSTTEAVKVVRCKDCRYWTGKDYDGCCIKNGLATRYEKDYCSYGKRREENEG